MCFGPEVILSDRVRLSGPVHKGCTHFSQFSSHCGTIQRSPESSCYAIDDRTSVFHTSVVVYCFSSESDVTLASLHDSIHIVRRISWNMPKFFT